MGQSYVNPILIFKAHPRSRRAANFAISRRRMVVPIYKRLEASLARVQIVKQGRITQLVLFLEDFSLGPCMNFVLKGTDNFESLSRSGKFFIRFIDAKFASPRREGEGNREFLCLDSPEYPGEHDDIMIGFDVEAGRRITRTIESS